MSVADKLNNWFDQFIKFDDNAASQYEEEQWALHSLDTMSKLFDTVYGEIPNKPATSKIHTFLTIVVNTINTYDQHKREAILTKLYDLKACYCALLETISPGEYYLSYLPHNLKVFYVDLISVLVKFPAFKPVVTTLAVTDAGQDMLPMIYQGDDIVNHPIDERIIALLNTIPANMDSDKKLLKTRDLLVSFVKHINSVEILTAVLDELTTEKYDYLRRDRNLLRTLAGTIAKNQTWITILNEIKEKTLALVRADIIKKQIISDETWHLAESIIHEHAMSATLFNDNYTDELEILHRKYIMQHSTEQVI